MRTLRIGTESANALRHHFQLTSVNRGHGRLHAGKCNANGCGASARAGRARFMVRSWRTRRRESRLEADLNHETKPRAAEIDPVCGMTVDPAKAAGSSTVDGKTFYFCSAGCKQRFDADPARYLEPAPPPSPSMPEVARPVWVCPMHPEV